MGDQRALTTQSNRIKSIRDGMRVLVVDDDAKSLNIVAVMLQALQYEVFPVKYVSDALTILREREGGFDIVLSVVNLPEMDEIGLLEHVESEFKIPVVMMSINDDEVVASKCLEKGASFYLLKPLTISDLSNLWQYVYLKRRSERMVIKEVGSVSELSRPRKISKGDIECANKVAKVDIECVNKVSKVDTECANKVSKEDVECANKVSKVDTECVNKVSKGDAECANDISKGDTECASSINESNWRQESKRKYSIKKIQNKGGKKENSISRVVWTTELHNKFLDAIDEIGLHRAVPMKILEVMNTPGITKENVASHLQKYRIFLKRIKQASESREPSVIKSMKHKALKSRFAYGHPSVSALLSLEQVFSCNPEQQRCSTSQLGDENLPERKQNKSKQPLLDKISSVNQQNDDKFSSSQMGTPNIGAGPSLCGGTPSTLASNTDTLLMIHKELRARTGHFASGSLDHSLNTTSFPSDNIQNVKSTGSVNHLTKGPNFCYANKGLAGSQMNSSIVKVSGLNQVHIGHEPANGNSCGYSRRDEIQNEKGPLVDTEKSPLILGFTSSHCDYASQGVTSSSGLMHQGLAPNGGLMPQGSISSGGFNQMHVGQKPANGTNCGYNRRDEIRNGKRPLVDTSKSPSIPEVTSSHSDYASQGLTSSSDLLPQSLAPTGLLVPQGSISSKGFSSTNPFSPILTNESGQLPLFSPPQPQLPLPPPPPPSQQQQYEIGSLFGNFSFEPSFDEGYLSDILFKPICQSPNQQEVCGEVVMDPEFSINEYKVDDDNLSLWIPP